MKKGGLKGIFYTKITQNIEFQILKSNLRQVDPIYFERRKQGAHLIENQ
jgi:hypothetical protein